MTLGSTVRENVSTARTIINGSPTTASEWQIVARQLRAAADAARRIAKIAARMNGGNDEDTV